jgi:hypothetical protein
MAIIAMTSADRIRSLLSRLNLSQRGAARLLRDAGVLATDRQVRAWCTGAEEVPEAAWLTLEDAIRRAPCSMYAMDEGNWYCDTHLAQAGGVGTGCCDAVKRAKASTLG